MRTIAILSVLAAAFMAEASNVVGKVNLANGRQCANAVVYLEGVGTAHPMANAIVDQRNRTFIPHVSVVTASTRVAFPNNDTIFHNVFADYDAKRFDLGMYSRGQTKYVVFPKPGLVALMCSVHPDMSAYIMVVDTPFYAVTDGHGDFAIHDVPDGAYSLKVWHESGQVETIALHVGGDLRLALKTHR